MTLGMVHPARGFLDAASHFGADPDVPTCSRRSSAVATIVVVGGVSARDPPWIEPRQPVALDSQMESQATGGGAGGDGRAGGVRPRRRGQGAADSSCPGTTGSANTSVAAWPSTPGCPRRCSKPSSPRRLRSTMVRWWSATDRLAWARRRTTPRCGYGRPAPRNPASRGAGTGQRFGRRRGLRERGAGTVLVAHDAGLAPVQTEAELRDLLERLGSGRKAKGGYYV